jgi:hypothetical protein
MSLAAGRPRPAASQSLKPVNRDGIIKLWNEEKNTAENGRDAGTMLQE